VVVLPTAADEGVDKVADGAADLARLPLVAAAGFAIPLATRPVLVEFVTAV
jgi:hypothetical protein